MFQFHTGYLWQSQVWGACGNWGCRCHQGSPALYIHSLALADLSKQLSAHGAHRCSTAGLTITRASLRAGAGTARHRSWGSTVGVWLCLCCVQVVIMGFAGQVHSVDSEDLNLGTWCTQQGHHQSSGCCVGADLPTAASCWPCNTGNLPLCPVHCRNITSPSSASSPCRC